LALTISIVFSSNKLNSFEELYKYISGLLLFLIAASLEYEDKIKIIRAIVITGLVISLLAIYQYFFGFQHILEYVNKAKFTDPFILDYISRNRVFFPFVTPNALGGYLAMLIPLTLVFKDKSWFIIPLSFALLLTKSLGALISLFLALGLYFYLKKGLEKKIIFFLYGLFLIICLVFVTRLTAQKQHLQPIFSTVMRLNYWKDTLNIIKARPLTGVGLGNFNLIQSRYAHNSYLQIWAEMGIFGLISFIWVITTVLKSKLQNIKYNSRKETIYLLIAVTTVILHNFVDFTFFMPEVMFIWWVILGLI